MLNLLMVAALICPATKMVYLKGAYPEPMDKEVITQQRKSCKIHTNLPCAKTIYKKANGHYYVICGEYK